MTLIASMGSPRSGSTSTSGVTPGSETSSSEDRPDTAVGNGRGRVEGSVEAVVRRTPEAMEQGDRGGSAWAGGNNSRVHAVKTGDGLEVKYFAALDSQPSIAAPSRQGARLSCAHG